tara:strand:- start:1658 stop:2059 length:402 start_codon:yes stop_codon:yes gene_type:complete
MAVQRVSRAFKDISLSFSMHPVTKDILVLKNADAIKRSIRNIVQTIPSERFFRPVLGTNIRSQLFDFVDFGTASIIEQQVLIAIENNEPRVENVGVTVSPKADTNEFEINVRFKVVGLELPAQQFTYLLEATR